jgi:hypothetical protein
LAAASHAGPEAFQPAANSTASEDEDTIDGDNGLLVAWAQLSFL